MIRLGVVGEDVSRSSSPAIHAFLMRRRFLKELVYEKVSIPPEDFHKRIGEVFSRFDGLNITVPYKEAVLPHLKEQRGVAETLGSVNTVLTGGRIGYNTDYHGFMYMLADAGVDVKERSALVLGAGGAGRSVVKALSDLGAEVFVYEKDLSRLQKFHARLPVFTPCERVPEREFGLIVNCTGVGSRQTEGTLPIIGYESGESDSPERLLKVCGGAADLIYGPKPSQFLRVAESYRKLAIGGGAMLFFQAYFSDCIFLDETPDGAEACSLWKQYRENL